jgi:DNA invertase Pin-like site-specific DNA recombinase
MGVEVRRQDRSNRTFGLCMGVRGRIARVSTTGQTTENQLLELRQYVVARGWTAIEYVDHGVSGVKDRRPALDQLTVDVRRHKVQAVICWRLDRLGRNLRHLVLLLDEWQHRGVAFVTLGEGIDTSTPAGRLVAGVLASIAEFERAPIQERIRAGLTRAKAQGRRLGRPKQDAPVTRLEAVQGLSVREASPTPWGLAFDASALACSRSAAVAVPRILPLKRIAFASFPA